MMTDILTEVSKWANSYQTDIKLADPLVWSTSNSWSRDYDRSFSCYAVDLKQLCVARPSTVRNTEDCAHLLLSDTRDAYVDITWAK